jgi:3',5'-nucleoside bisphosphate phosphatase
MLAITDHDSIDGYLAVRNLALESGVPKLIAGVEMSCVWGKHTVHIVGLNINPNCQQFCKGLDYLRQARAERAHLISERLAALGFKGAYDYVVKRVGDGQIGRPHFAQFLVEQGHVRSVSAAFKRYLGAGKPGDVKTVWPAASQVVQWITAGGGVAVLAHPLHYKMTATKLRALITDFKAAGGGAMEVISGRQTPQQTDYLANLVEQFQLLASVGSDFHLPQQWSELGKVGKLPARCQPVWSAWQ